MKGRKGRFALEERPPGLGAPRDTDPRAGSAADERVSGDQLDREEHERRGQVRPLRERRRGGRLDLHEEDERAAAQRREASRLHRPVHGEREYRRGRGSVPSHLPRRATSTTSSSPPTRSRPTRTPRKGRSIHGWRRLACGGMTTMAMPEQASTVRRSARDVKQTTATKRSATSASRPGFCWHEPDRSPAFLGNERQRLRLRSVADSGVWGGVFPTPPHRSCGSSRSRLYESGPDFNADGDVDGGLVDNIQSLFETGNPSGLSPNPPPLRKRSGSA